MLSLNIEYGLLLFYQLTLGKKRRETKSMKQKKKLFGDILRRKGTKKQKQYRDKNTTVKMSFVVKDFAKAFNENSLIDDFVDKAHR